MKAKRPFEQIDSHSSQVKSTANQHPSTFAIVQGDTPKLKFPNLMSLWANYFVERIHPCYDLKQLSVYDVTNPRLLVCQRTHRVCAYHISQHHKPQMSHMRPSKWRLAFSTREDVFTGKSASARGGSQWRIQTKI